MNILQSLDNTVLKYIKANIKLGSLSKEQLQQIIALQSEYLQSIQKSMIPFDKVAMISLYNKYRSAEHTPTDKNDISQLFLALPTKLKGGIGSKEQAYPFSTVVSTAKVFSAILSEINKNIDKIIGDGGINIYNCRISSVMTLGILREIDIFTQTATILWKHFTDTCFNDTTSLLGYQSAYVRENFDKYINIINNVLSREHNYNFLQDIGDVQKKNSDLVLYANSQSFLHMLNPANLTKNAYHHLEYGIIGFGVITWMIQQYDDWKHAKYLKNKDFKSWLEARATLLRLELNGADRNSNEYQKLLQIIQAYDAKIVEYDRKLAEYERG